MINKFTPGPAAAWLAERLIDAQALVAERLAFSPSSIAQQLVMLLPGIAEHLALPPGSEIADPTLLRRAADIGAARFAQAGTVTDLLREYLAFADGVDEILRTEVASASGALSAEDVAHAMSTVTQAVRALQQRSVQSFVECHTQRIEQQAQQLTAFGRLVGHEMRQPLGVLQVMAGVMPVREGDAELTHLIDVFERNVRRLTDVATRLERLSHDALDGVAVASDEAVDLRKVVVDVVDKLRDMADAHGVDIHVDAGLPMLRVNPARTEMVFVSLIANAIKYSDPAKRGRFVEIVADRDETQPTVVVRDNGVGMPARRVQHLFREFTRAHAYRDRGLTDQGLGLGLAIVRSSMDASGGRVALDSEEGVGTTVTLTWPVRTRRL